MVDLATLASANSIRLEVKKDGLQQRQSGDWMLRVVFSATDYSEVLGRAPMGTRFACVMVEINDDETPVDHKSQDRDKWRDLGPTKQAALRCKEPVFWAFLREGILHFSEVRDEASAAAAVRNYCGVASRSEFSKPGFHKSRTLWHGLDSEF